MNIFEFAKEKLLSIFLTVISMTVITIMLYLFEVNVNLIILINMILILSYVTILLYDFYRLKSYYGELRDVFKQLDEKTLITDIVDEPKYYSGQVYYNILRETTKDMNDRISMLKQEQQEYHDYIDLWVHEIKTPITGLKLLLTNHRSPETADMQLEISKIDEQVEQALYYARSSMLYQDYKIQTFTLESVVNEAVKSLSVNIIRAKGIVNITNLDQMVTSDPKWIVFILKQLITNSIKYRSDALELSLSKKKVDNGTILRVEDNGIGINDSDIERVFERGFTGINGRKYSRSTGMGLYLCKELCEKLDLSMKILSKENEGTTIEIYFPDKFKWFD